MLLPVHLSTLSMFSALRSPACWLGLLVLVTPLWAGAADDSYLREVEEEAKRQATTLIIPPISQPPATSASDATATNDRVASGLNQAAFEQALRDKQTETYASYQKLTAAAQQQVYEAYQSDNRLATIGDRITQLLGAKP